MHAFDTVINVNPAMKPAGALDPEVARGAIRSRVYRQGTAIARRTSGKMLRRVFGPTSFNKPVSLAILALRYAFAAWMLITAGSEILSSGVSLEAAAMIFAGVISALGFGMRVISFCGFVVTGYVTCHALRAGMPVGLMGYMVPAFALFAVTGPGRYSLDSKLRRNIFRMVCRRQARRLLANRFSYRAYEFAHMM